MLPRNLARRLQKIVFDGVHEKLCLVVCMKQHRHGAMHLRYILWEYNGTMFMLDDPTYEEVCAIAKKAGTGFDNWNIVELDCPACKQEVLCPSKE